MAYKWMFYDIQTLLVWHTTGDFCIRVGGCSYATQGEFLWHTGGTQATPKYSQPWVAEGPTIWRLARSCQREGGKNCSEDICTVSPLDVTLWHTKLQKRCENSQGGRSTGEPRPCQQACPKCCFLAKCQSVFRVPSLALATCMCRARPHTHSLVSLATG